MSSRITRRCPALPHQVQGMGGPACIVIVRRLGFGGAVTFSNFMVDIDNSCEYQGSIEYRGQFSSPCRTTNQLERPMLKTSELRSAAELAQNSPVRFPNESAAYRRARTALLAEEIMLRRQIEHVAEQRRALPPAAR